MDPFLGSLIISTLGGLFGGGQERAQSEQEFEYQKQLMKMQQDFQKAMTRPMDFNQAMDLMNQQLNSRGLWNSDIALDRVRQLYMDYGITPGGTAPGVAYTTPATTTPITAADSFSRNKQKRNGQGQPQMATQAATLTPAVVQPQASPATQAAMSFSAPDYGNQAGDAFSRRRGPARHNWPNLKYRALPGVA